jgi:hypothetical protein
MRTGLACCDAFVSFPELARARLHARKLASSILAMLFLVCRSLSARLKAANVITYLPAPRNSGSFLLMADQRRPIDPSDLGSRLETQDTKIGSQDDR